MIQDIFGEQARRPADASFVFAVVNLHKIFPSVLIRSDEIKKNIYKTAGFYVTITICRIVC